MANSADPDEMDLSRGFQLFFWTVLLYWKILLYKYIEYLSRKTAEGNEYTSKRNN